MNISNLVFILAIELISIIVTKNQKMQRTTLALGKYLALGNNLAPKNGFQDAITPRTQNWSNGLLILGVLLVIVGFFIFPWYIPLMAFALALLTMIFANVIERYRPPQPLAPLAGRIIGDLARRSADYRIKGDKDRAKAAKEMSEMISEAMEKITIQLGDNATIEQLEIITGQKKT